MLISYQVVIADGSIINASAKSNQDLFWALKGGSNNFGRHLIPSENRIAPHNSTRHCHSVHPLHLSHQPSLGRPQTILARAAARAALRHVRVSIVPEQRPLRKRHVASKSHQRQRRRHPEHGVSQTPVFTTRLRPLLLHPSHLRHHQDPDSYRDDEWTNRAGNPTVRAFMF